MEDTETCQSRSIQADQLLWYCELSLFRERDSRWVQRLARTSGYLTRLRQQWECSYRLRVAINRDEDPAVASDCKLMLTQIGAMQNKKGPGFLQGLCVSSIKRIA